MKTHGKSKVFGWSFGLIIFLGVILTMSDLFNITAQSEEGRLMSDAWQDLKAHETLRVEFDFDQLQSVMSSHSYSFRDQSDTVMKKALSDVEKLKEEAIFHNTNQEWYQNNFSKVLLQLTYLELEDAVFHFENSMKGEIKGDIELAQKHLHDALSFSRKPVFKEYLNLLHEVNRLNELQPDHDQLEHTLHKIRELI